MSNLGGKGHVTLHPNTVGSNPNLVSKRLYKPMTSVMRLIQSASVVSSQFLMDKWQYSK